MAHIDTVTNFPQKNEETIKKNFKQEKIFIQKTRRKKHNSKK
tara:strand:+ start:304 stop:429 length:126 start_codon:yes stop_codon:yes gene_type:complete